MAPSVDRRCPAHCTLAQSRERAVAPGVRTGVASIAAAPGGDRCERASENDRLRSLGTHRPKRVDVWHPTSALARSACIDSRASQCMAPSIDRPCPPHCTLAQSRERAVAPAISRGGIDRRRSGRRSMANVQARTIASARRTALSLRAASVQWHPACERGWHRSPPLWAEIDDERASANDRLCPPHCTLAQSRERAVAPCVRTGVASIAAALGGDRWRTCKRERSPLPVALHSRSEPRACSGTLIGAGWHRSPPLWAEIDGERASANDRLCPSHCTLAQSRERAVAPSLARGGLDRRRSGRRSMRTCERRSRVATRPKRQRGRAPWPARHTSPAFGPTQAGEAGRCVAPSLNRACSSHCPFTQSRGPHSPHFNGVEPGPDTEHLPIIALGPRGWG